MESETLSVLHIIVPIWQNKWPEPASKPTGALNYNPCSDQPRRAAASVGERQQRAGQSECSCIHRCSWETSLFTCSPSACLFPGNLALQRGEKKKKEPRCFHTNKPISNHYAFPPRVRLQVGFADDLTELIPNLVFARLRVDLNVQ